MYFAQYYQRSAVSNDVIEGCGDRSVFILDGRNTIETMADDAESFGRKHGWIAYSLHKGDSLTRGVVSLSPTMPINRKL